MPPSDNFQVKLTQAERETFINLLNQQEREFIIDIAAKYCFSFQEIRLAVEAARDLEIWREHPLRSRWADWELQIPGHLLKRTRKEALLGRLTEETASLRALPAYPPTPIARPQPLQSSGTITADKNPSRKLVGKCPVCSDRTVCCGLLTIDAVQSCPYSCSYCTVQTFYSGRAVFDADLREKLEKIEIADNCFYRFGTGQSSDSLAWGNSFGMLDTLLTFARAHSNILLELKTKSDNVDYILDNEVPRNVVCSWSLNSPTIINHEEHHTASLTRRLEAARRVADKKIAIAFHFHPLVHYQKCLEEYRHVIERVLGLFSPEEVAFISFGTVTFIKPVVKAIRKRGFPTKITQMTMAEDPHGKLTYPDDIKRTLFQMAYEAFHPWHGQTYFYLCMEKAEIWDALFGWHYQSNEAFLKDFGKKMTARRTGSITTTQI